MPVVIYGSVRNPARFELRRRVRLIELIALAGGLSEDAAQTVSILHTESPSVCVEIAPDIEAEPESSSKVYNLSDVLRNDERSNPYLRPGDVISVSWLGVIYVTGDVVNPRGIYLREPMTVTQAIAAAGGVLPNSRDDRVLIYRAVPGEGVTTIKVDIKAIKKHRADDVVLQPHDIVEVLSKNAPGPHRPVIIWRPQPQYPLRVIQ